MNKNIERVLIFSAVVVIYSLNLFSNYNTDLEKNVDPITLTKGGYKNTLTSLDNVPNTFLPYLILEKGTFYFDEIIDVIRKYEDEGAEHPYFLLNNGEGLISVYPVATVILVLPLYVIPFLLKNPDLGYFENILQLMTMGRIAGTLLTTGAVMFIYEILNKISDKKNLNLLLLTFYAFGTSLYSITSRGLWMHTSSLFIISLILYILVVKKLSDKLVMLLGFLLGFLFLIRPTNIVISLPLFMYLVIKHKGKIKFLVAGISPTVLLYLLNNYLFFGSIFSEGYSGRNDISWTTSYLESIPGYFISPGRGFLFLAPPLLLGFLFLVRRNLKPLYKTLAFIVVFQILLLGKWWAWEGANAFGARMLTEITPILLIFVAEKAKNFKKAGIITLSLLIFYSIYVQTNAVWFKQSRCDEQHNWTFNCLRLPKSK